MPINEFQLRLWIGEHVHWSRFFPSWLLKIYRAGLTAGYSVEALTPLLDQLDQELSEGHAGQLMRVLPELPTCLYPSAHVNRMMTAALGFDGSFEVGVALLTENERFAAQLYAAILREAADIEGFDPSFFQRHVELDEGEHADGVEQLCRLTGTSHMLREVTRHFRNARLVHLRHHFGDQVDSWFTP